MMMKNIKNFQMNVFFVILNNGYQYHKKLNKKYYEKK